MKGMMLGAKAIKATIAIKAILAMTAITAMTAMTATTVLAQSQSQEHLRVDGIELGRPYAAVVRDLEWKGYIQKTSAEEGALLVGSYADFERVACWPMRENDTCRQVMMIVPDPGSARGLFSAYNKMRALITEVYGVYGHEENHYVDEGLNDFSPIEDRINAVRFELAYLNTRFELPNGEVRVGIDVHEATGLGVFATFEDKQPAPTDAWADLEEEGVMKIETGVLTRFKGINLDNEVDEVLAELKAKGLREDNSLLTRQMYRKQHKVKMKGEAFGYPDCEVILSGESHLKSLTVNLPKMKNWQQLYALYARMRQTLATTHHIAFRATDQVGGVTQQLDKMDSATALNAIRRGEADLQTILPNTFDHQTMKVAISYLPYDDSFRVVVVFWTHSN